ncbi:hypothetical protein [Flavisphingomonas formosensis]|uniref:hypothetical protein n=1 Tax=Flavisphingomonas formosensis TaxID=861534 RepID=UPI0012FC284B|nr:hypothetical protein [Sphingomonas formosensis]
MTRITLTLIGLAASTAAVAQTAPAPAPAPGTTVHHKVHHVVKKSHVVTKTNGDAAPGKHVHRSVKTTTVKTPAGTHTQVHTQTTTSTTPPQ